MFEYHVTFRALSAAQKARRYLTEEGIGAVLSRSPKTMSEQGCGFVLRLSAQDAMFAIGILRRRSAASPPCTIPNSMWPAGAPSKARLQRSAQRTVRSIERLT